MLSKLLRRLRSALVGTLPLLAAASLAQTTIHVPSAATPTIQAGINAASDGDTVLVAPGTYYENINFSGKAITVTSSGGAASTIINGGRKAATVIFNQDETRASVLSNFTITGGQGLYYTPIGGIFMQNASPTILSNTITANQCYGVNSQDSSPLIQGNEISFTYAQNETCGFAGGDGIWISQQLSNITPVIAGNTIEENTESGLDQDAGGNGGAGIAVWYASATIQQNVIRNNATGKVFSSGGGGEGGGILFYKAGGLVFNNLIYGNSSGGDGGGISFESGPPVTLINNTIADNLFIPVIPGAGPGGQQLYFSQYADITFFYNNIISGSTSEPSIVCLAGTNSVIDFENNDLFNDKGSLISTPNGSTACAFPSGLYGDISVNPEFASSASQDYQLASGSPAIDRGTNSALQIALADGLSITTDLNGNPRIQNGSGAGCIIDMGAYEYPSASPTCGTIETLQSSLNPSGFGQTVTFTAQLSSTSGLPTGDVAFTDGNTALGTETISGTGVSTYSTGQLSVGSHTITATYQPTGNFPAASAMLTQVVNGIATTTTLSCSPTSIYINGTALLAATVTSSSGTPTGSIAFTDNGTALATQALVSGTTSLNYTGSVAGSHTLMATYTPTGAFAGGSASCTETVTALPTTSILTVTPTTANSGTPVTLTANVSPTTAPGAGTPGGMVTFYNSATAIGTGTLANGVASLTVSTLSGGPASLTCLYGGSSVYTTSQCNSVSVTINAAATSTSLTVTPNPGYFGQQVAMVATVSSLSSPSQLSGGTVTFYDGTTPLGTQTLTAYANATLSIATLAVGTHPITATFIPPNSGLNSSTSPVVNEVILPSAFAVALSPTSITLVSGTSGQVAIQLASVGNFAGPLALTYGTLPANAMASISPVTVTLAAGATGSSTLTLNTELKAANAMPTSPGTRALPVIFTAFVFLLVPFSVARRRKVVRLLSLILFAMSFQALTGCYNNKFSVEVVGPGTYLLPVIAIDTKGNSQSALLTINVTP